MFDRIVVDVIKMGLVVALIPDCLFPESILPYDKIRIIALVFELFCNFLFELFDDRRNRIGELGG